MILSDSPENIQHAARLLADGELVAIPTETVYGLAAHAENASAIDKIYTLKGRPSYNPLIVHVLDAQHAQKYIRLSPWQNKTFAALTEKFWPGPLTLVLPCNTELLPANVRAGLPSVALRAPAHPITREILKISDLALAAPSANPSGYVSATTAAHVEKSFMDHAPVTIDGGPCKYGIESTIVSLLNDTPQLLRPGAVSLESLEQVIGTIKIHQPEKNPSEEQAAISPGLLTSHYAPRAKVLFLSEYQAKPLRANRLGRIRFSENSENIDNTFFQIDLLGDNLLKAASGLFAALRKADELECDLIVVDEVPAVGLGRALMDRLKRAAAEK